MIQQTLFATPEFFEEVRQWIIALIKRREQPSAAELIRRLEEEVGLESRYIVTEVISGLTRYEFFTILEVQYLQSLLDSGEILTALHGEVQTGKAIESSIDVLVSSTARYRGSKDFRELLEFMARFREYAAYNNMLVRVQNPSCSFFATKRDWQNRFGRQLKEDARPMLILAVMGPLMCVYDIDQTEGEDLPEDIAKLSQYTGLWNPDWLEKLKENAEKFGILVQVKELSSTNSGFATTRSKSPWKMRIVLHDKLDERAQFGVLCHELAHIFLGHLGQDIDRYWPSRVNLTHAAVEVEAESVAYLVTERYGLKGNSDAYLAALMHSESLPLGVSLDNIARVTGLIEKMARESVTPRKRRSGQQR